MKVDPKLVKYIRSLGLDFDFDNLTENDWFMIEEIVGESIPVDGEEDESEDIFGEEMFF